MTDPYAVEEIPFFQFFPEEELVALRALFTRHEFAFGDVIMEQGAPADALYILVSGRARVSRRIDDEEEVPLNVLGEGDEFGEMALVEGGHRTATVRCSTAVEVLRLDRETFEHYLNEHPEARAYVDLRIRHRRLHNFLREGSTLGRLPLTVLRDFLSRLSESTFRPGAPMVRQNDPDGGFYVLVDGQARVYQRLDGKDRSLGYLRSGDYFGELSVLRDAPCHATVEAVTMCTVLTLPKERLRELLDMHPALHVFMEQRASAYAEAQPDRVPLDVAVAQGRTVTVASLLHEDKELDPEVRPRGFLQALRSPHVPQLDEMDCGAAALATACIAVGRPVRNMPKLRDFVYAGPQGSSLTALRNAATELLGLEAHAVRMQNDGLRALPLPVILHLRDGHWVVLLRLRRQRAQVSDPATGVGWVPLNLLTSRWSGHALTVRTGSTQAPEQHPVPTPWLAECVREAGGTFFPATALAIPQAATILVVIGLARNLEHNAVLPEVSASMALTFAVLVLLAGWTIALVRSGLVRRTEQAVTAVVIRRLSSHLLRQPLSRVLQRQPGEWAQRYDDALRIVRHMAQMASEGAFAGAMFFIAGGIALTTSKMFATLVTVSACLSLLTGYGATRRSRRAQAEQDQIHSPLWERAVPVIRNADMIKICNADGQFSEYLLERARQVLRLGGMSTSAFRSGDFLGMLLMGLAVSVMLTISLGFLPVAPSVDRVVGGIFLSAMAIYGSLRVGVLLAQEHALRIARMRLDDLFASPTEDESGHRLPVPSLAGKITLRRISARYTRQGAPALSNIDLEIPPGGCLALVGTRGAGKSTLIRLLATLMDPTEGALLYDGISASDLSRKGLRDHIGVLSHRPDTLPGTIKQNLCGAAAPDRARFEAAIRTVGLESVLAELPDGYDTMLGPEGWKLTQEEQQRLALARIIYHRPAVALLDDGLRDLDEISARDVLQSSLELLSDSTRVFVPRRIAHCRFANVIAVMDNGRIVECGTHDELLARGGVYWHLRTRELEP